MKFTFKTEKATGPYRAFHSDSHYIKYNKQVCGSIDDVKPYKIRFMVEKDGEKYDDGNPNCSWVWVSLKGEFESVQDAKIFINEHKDAILSKGLHLMND